MYNDDKYAKADAQKTWLMHPAVSQPLEKSQNAGLFFRNPWKMYAGCLLSVMAVYHLSGGNVFRLAIEDMIGVFSCILETMGLISIAFKIQKNGSVAGISGNAMILFFLSYVLREGETLLTSQFIHLSRDGALLEALQIMSLPVLGTVLWAIFKTHRSTYQESLDVLKTPYLVIACMVVAIFIRPNFSQGRIYSYSWTASFYVDVLALLPQVVMMAYDTEKIKAPVANFVAATAFSRLVDLWFWYYRFDLGPQGYIWGFNYSGWLIVFLHVVSLAIVGDFLYYYLRARLAGKAFTDDLSLDSV